MFQSAVFVDAGYLFALGAAALGDADLKRPDLTLDAGAAVTALRDASAAFAPSSRLLRIYWYDALIRGGQLTADQSRVARMDDVKFRSGVLNSAGRQKGVDSLIITDLIELARNKSITDAVLLGGDEDLRAGLQIAQTFGVRIQVIGLTGNEQSQSPTLISEADSNRLWTSTEFGRIVGKRSATQVPVIRPDATWAQIAGSTATDDAIARAIETIIEQIAISDDKAAILDHVRSTGGIPPEVDRPALGQLGDALGRKLNFSERAKFREALKEAIGRSFVNDIK